MDVVRHRICFVRSNVVEPRVRCSVPAHFRATPTLWMFEMKHAVTRGLYGYWNQLRGGRAAPERAEIDPAMIREILADTFILETGDMEEESLFAIRLSGTRLNALMLTELKGWSMLSLFGAEDRAGLLRIMRCVLDHRTPAVVGLRGGPVDHPPISLEMILLPLRHHGKTHSRVLGALAPFDLPSWLGLLPIEHFSLATLRFIEPSTFVAGFSRPVAPETVTAVKRFGALKVHEGGRSA